VTNRDTTILHNTFKIIPKNGQRIKCISTLSLLLPLETRMNFGKKKENFYLYLSR
jgi:hypothetical protein